MIYDVRKINFIVLIVSSLHSVAVQVQFITLKVCCLELSQSFFLRMSKINFLNSESGIFSVRLSNIRVNPGLDGRGGGNFTPLPLLVFP